MQRAKTIPLIKKVRLSVVTVTDFRDSLNSGHLFVQSPKKIITHR